MLDVSQSDEKQIKVVSNRVSEILKPTLQENDFLQSFVRISLDDNEDEEAKKNRHQEVSGGKRRFKGLRRVSLNERHRTVQESLEMDVKEQKSRLKKRRRSEVVLRQEEIYTDKDRAAAVNLGSRDIKQSLKIKRRQDRSKALQIPEEADPSAILALAFKQITSANHENALDLINKALELSPKDKKALIARSKCHLRLGEAQKALQDAESALEINLKDIDKSRAIFCKAEALFHLGDFEMSLVYYHRGMKIRPEFDHFRQGVQKAKEAIQNILEKQVITVVPGHSEQPQIKSDLDAPARPQTPPKVTVPDLSSASFSEPSTVTGLVGNENKIQSANDTSFVSTKLGGSKRASDILTSSIAKDRKKGLAEAHLLGRLNVDKKYLQNLLKRPDIKIPYQDSARHITMHAQEGIHFLQTRQEFWRQQRANIDQHH